MSTESVRIRVELDTTDAQRKVGDMERGFERTSRVGSAAFAAGAGRLLSAATAAFGATIGARTLGDIGSLASGGPVGDMAQNLSNSLGFGGAARRTGAVQRARDMTAGTLGQAADSMTDEGIRTVFKTYLRQTSKEASGYEKIRKATELEMSKAGEIDGSLGEVVEMLTKIYDKMGAADYFGVAGQAAKSIINR